MPGGRPKGQARTGGRQAGTPNKRSVEASEVFGRARFDPLRRMIDLAYKHERVMKDIEAEERKNPGSKLENLDAYGASLQALFPLYKELTQYLYPKRKAIEITGDDGGPLTVYHRYGAPPQGETPETE